MLITRFVRLASLYLTFAFAVASSCLAQSGVSPANKPVGGVLTRGAARPAHQANSTNNGIAFNGGAVMDSSKGVNVYYIWYGDWSSNPGARQILTDFVIRDGGSPYFNINTTYYGLDPNGRKDFVLNRVNYIASTDDHYSLGTYLSDNAVAQVVNNATGPGKPLPIDTNGVYFVITSPDVSEQESAGIGGPACAWHGYWALSYSAYPGQIFDIKLGWIGDPNTYNNYCGVQDPSPNNNPDADSMTNLIAHELEESVTDPDGTAWVNPDGSENADLCVWTFGCTFTGYGFTFTGGPACRLQTSNGAYYNMKVGQKEYMIQRNWVNAKGGYCSLHWDE
jgi:Phosphate-induced protein 1 conserved region